MNFTLPTTKSEMYQTLKQIYNYYRLNAVVFESTPRQPLEIERLEFIALTDSELLQKAQTLTDASITREKKEKQSDIKSQILTVNDKIEKLNAEYEKIYIKVDEEYESLKEKLRKESVQKGVAYSSLLTDKMYELDNQKTQKILQTQSEKSSKIAELEAQITALNSELVELDDYFIDLKTKDVDIKFIELKEAQDKKEKEVFKYNNLANEKEIRYNNANIYADASLELRYLEAKNNGFSKEALVDMGYYSDVLDCICGYYDRLAPSTAYLDIKEEKDLMLYMEDYYSNLLSIYKIRAQG